VGIARCGNIYGGGDLNYSRLVPGTIRAIRLGRRPVVRSGGTHTRDYLYVRDAVRAYLLLAKALVRGEVLGEAFNFSGGRPASVLEVMGLISRLMGLEGLEPVAQHEAVPEIPHQRLDTDKARRVLGWEPVYSLEEGLEETVDWYLKFWPSTTNPMCSKT